MVDMNLIEFGIGLTAVSTVALFLQALWSAWYFVLYFLVTVNVALVVLLCVSSYDQTLAVKVTQVIFQILWAPVSVVLQLRTNLFQMVCERGSADVIHYPRDQATIPDWLRQALMVALIDGASSTSMRWLLIFGACKLMSRTIGDIYGTQRLPEEEDTWADKPSALRNPRSGLAVLVMALSLGYFQSTVQVAVTLGYCILTDTSGLPKATKLIKYLCFDTDLLNGLEANVALGVYLGCETIMSSVLILYGVFNQNPLALPCLYFNAMTPLLKLQTDVWLKVRQEDERLRDFPLASVEKLRDHGDVCPICLANITSGRETPCGHIFHSGCLRLSLRETSKCPMCKSHLRTRSQGIRETDFPVWGYL